MNDAERIQEKYGVVFVFRRDPVDHRPVSTLTEDEVVKVESAARFATSVRGAQAEALEEFAADIPANVYDPRHIADMARERARKLRGGEPVPEQKRTPRNDTERFLADTVSVAAMACGADLTADQILFLVETVVDEQARVAEQVEDFRRSAQAAEQYMNVVPQEQQPEWALRMEKKVEETLLRLSGERALKAALDRPGVAE